MLRSFLFPRSTDCRTFSLFLLALRILFGSLLMFHGLGKLMSFEELSVLSADPLGIGSQFSLVLAIFGELFCSVAFIFGLLYRLSMLPMLATMAVAFFGIHQASVAQGELAFVYLLVLILMYFAGPGRYSVDYLIRRSMDKPDFSEEV
ncbi:MAG: DoxX family protein [Bacteroides sp.]|nr:DoxX family protein [Bacteroides sp.]